MKKIIIGILPQEKIRERMLAIGRGDYTPKKGEPKVWFSSMKSLAEVLSDQNRALLQVIAETKPDSLTELAKRGEAKVNGKKGEGDHLACTSGTRKVRDTAFLAAGFTIDLR